MGAARVRGLTLLGMIDNGIPPLLTTAQHVLSGEDRRLRRRSTRGELVRVRAGVFVDAESWKALDPDGRYRTVVHAASRTLEIGSQFSHDSAAALWHLPSIGAWPRTVHVLARPELDGSSSSVITRHAIGLDPHAELINSAHVSSLARTVVDSARSTTFLRAVCMADAAMAEPEKGTFRALNGVRPTTHDELAFLLDALPRSAPGVSRARKVLGFSTTKSGSPGESMSRVQFELLGYPPPELQVPFHDEGGLIGYADFYWPELDLIGEFDGDVKYRDRRYLRGRLPEEVVIAERHRENRMRRQARAFERWGWSTARDQHALAALLRPHGLIPRR